MEIYLNFLKTIHKWIVTKQEFALDCYYTYHLRPKAARKPKKSLFLQDHADVAIVIQGPITTEDDFTLNTIILLKQNYPGIHVILSTWNDQCTETLKRIAGAGATIIQNTKPEFSGTQNINYQIKSTQAGLRYARQMGIAYSLKLRTDQRFYNPDTIRHLKNLLTHFPIECDTLNNRIVALSINTFRFRIYGVSDMFFFGSTKDLIQYWACDFDNRVICSEDVHNHGNSMVSFSKLELCEVYLCASFLRRLGATLSWTVSDYANQLARYFIIVDAATIDLYWRKYEKNLEVRWMRYDGNWSSEEVCFSDWLSHYLGNMISESHANKMSGIKFGTQLEES
jgi:hypothetical protein